MMVKDTTRPINAVRMSPLSCVGETVRLQEVTNSL
jgi:hypothetical protein